MHLSKQLQLKHSASTISLLVQLEKLQTLWNCQFILKNSQVLSFNSFAIYLTEKKRHIFPFYIVLTGCQYITQKNTSSSSSSCTCNAWTLLAMSWKIEPVIFFNELKGAWCHLMFLPNYQRKITEIRSVALLHCWLPQSVLLFWDQVAFMSHVLYANFSAPTSSWVILMVRGMVNVFE